MARLPVPGSDNGSWGSILNDFLAEAHGTDGTLKAGSVSNATLQNGIVTTSKLATNNSPTAGQVLSYSGSGMAWTAPATNTPQPSGNATSGSGLGSLFIFYSPPNIMNGRYSDDYAAGLMSRYSDVIIGSGLQQTANAYHASTVAIIQKIGALDTGTTCWGYIDVGVTTSNHSLATLQTQIDEWVVAGATGIFCDLVGYDYHVSRARQNAVISYIHGKGLPAFLNVWNIDDLLRSAIDATYNPTGTATVANSTDVAMLESWICNSDAYSSPYYATFGDIKTRADKAIAYRNSIGIRIFATSIFSHSNHTTQQIKDMYDYTNAFARIFRLDGSGLAASNYGSTGVDLGIARAFFSDIRSTPLRPTAPYSLNNTWTQVDATDLGLRVTFDPNTSTYSWTQE